MKLISQSYNILGTPESLEEAWEFVEKATRCCYQSERKDNTETSEQFCRRILLKHKDWVKNHGAMLEHGTVYLTMPAETILPIYANDWYRYAKNKYSTDPISDGNGNVLITTNLRVILENGWEEDLKFACAPTKYHEKRYTVNLITALHVYKDLTRHRVMSYGIESTRFCNYLKEKFGGSIAFINPIWLKPEDLEEFKKDCAEIESIYFKWIQKGYKAQEAAYFLCQGIKGEVYMTGTAEDWKHLFILRSHIAASGPPHPMVLEAIEPVYQEFVNRNYIEALDGIKN